MTTTKQGSRKGSRAEAAQVVATLASTVGLDRAAELLRADTALHVRVSSARLDLYRAAAKAEGVTLTRWVLRVLDGAAQGR